MCDHSPTLCLAAAGRLPTLIAGTGFTVPPVSGRFYPVLDHRASPVVSQDQVFSVICEVQRQRGQRLPATLPQAFAGDARFVTTLPELDCYPGLRTDAYVPTIDTAAEVRPATDRFAFLRTWQATLRGWRYSFRLFHRRGYSERPIFATGPRLCDSGFVAPDTRCLNIRPTCAKCCLRFRS